MPRRRVWGLTLAALGLARLAAPAAWLQASSEPGSAPAAPRRAVLALGSAALSTAVGGRAALAEQLDQYGRPLMPDGSLGGAPNNAAPEGLSYEGVASFNGKPRVFVAGATGELGRRVGLDLLKSGYSVRLGYRDRGKADECQYALRKSAKYEMIPVKDVLVETGRQQELEEAIGDASVVIDTAGARYGFDIFRPGTGLDNSEPEKIDLNGTKALIDAAVAKGVKKFIYVSAILTNARALGEEVSESDSFKNWNKFGNVLDYKHEAEEYLKKSGLDYTIIRPAPMTNDFPNSIGGIWFGKPDAIRLQSGEIGKTISRDDVSLALLDAVFNPKASKMTAELVDAPGKKPTTRAAWWDLQDQPVKAA